METLDIVRPDTEITSPTIEQLVFYPHSILKALLRTKQTELGAGFSKFMTYQFLDKGPEPIDYRRAQFQFLDALKGTLDLKKYFNSPDFAYLDNYISSSSTVQAYGENRKYITITLLRLLEILEINVYSDIFNNSISLLLEKVNEAVAILYNDYQEALEDELNAVIL